VRDIAVSRGRGAGLNVRDIGVYLVTTASDRVLAGLMCDIGVGATCSENYTILYSIRRGPRPGPRVRELARRNTLATLAPPIGPRERELGRQRKNSWPQQTPQAVSDVSLCCPGSHPTSCAQPRECSNAGHAGRLLVNMCIGFIRIDTWPSLSLSRALCNALGISLLDTHGHPCNRIRESCIPRHLRRASALASHSHSTF
jgi:hypothetical protein